MSLSHGHFYMADKFSGALGGPLQKIITTYPDDYRLGALGPDILFWAREIASKNPFGPGAEPEDPHIGDTGRFVHNIIKTALHHMNHGTPGARPFMAFAIGWLSHWSTDLYVHSLVNKYHGNYEQDPSRHLQLELVETKYIQEKYKKSNIEKWKIVNNLEIWKFFDDVFLLEHRDDKKNYKRKGNFEKDSPQNNELDYLGFGFESMKNAYQEAKESCIQPRTESGLSLEQEKLAIVKRREERKAAPEDLINTEWTRMGGFIPTDKTFKELVDPIDVQVVSAGDHLDVEVTVADTGLYGKFLVDYEPFISGAVARASEMAAVVNEYLDHLADQAETSHSKIEDAGDWEGRGFGKRLNKFLYDDGGTDSINILVPEPHWPMLSKESPEIASVLESDGPSDYATDRAALQCELEVVFLDDDLQLISQTAPIKTTSKNRLYGSKRAKSSFRIPVKNPKNMPYYYRLKVSLAVTEKPFDDKYEDIEFTYVTGVQTDIQNIRSAKAITVGYKGALAYKRPESKPQMQSLPMPLPFALPDPKREITVETMNAELYWQGNRFTAKFTEKRDNRPVTMPGHPEEPVCGEFMRSIEITGTADFDRKVVSFDAKEKVTSSCDNSDAFHNRLSKQSFSASGAQVLEFGEDGNSIRFGVDNYKTLLRSSAEYISRSISKGKFVGENSETTEFLDNTRGDEQKRCLYIEFRF